MADETANAQGQEVDKAQEQEATDWQAKYEAMRAHSREWEKQAKANKAAAEELEKLKNAQASDESEAEKRAAKAEAKLAALEERAERQEVVSKVASDAKVPAEVVGMLNGKDGDELAEQVGRLLELLPAYPVRTDDGGGKAVAGKTNGELFAEVANSMFK